MNFSYFFPPSPSLTSLLPSLKPFLPKHFSYSCLCFVCDPLNWIKISCMSMGRKLVACSFLHHGQLYHWKKKWHPFHLQILTPSTFSRKASPPPVIKIIIGPILYRSYANKHSSSEFLRLVAVSHPEHIFRLALRHSTSNFRRRLFAALLPLTLIPPPLWQNKNPQLSQLMNSCECHGISDFL